MSHTDFVAKVPEGFENIGKTVHCPNAAMQNIEKNFYGIQFHPEVTHTEYGNKILYNFIYFNCLGHPVSVILNLLIKHQTMP